MKAIPVLAVAALLLTGCGAMVPAPTQAPTAPVTQANDSPTGGSVTAQTVEEPHGPGTYLVGIESALVTLDIPATDHDPEAAAILSMFGITPKSWVRATIDNTNGQAGTSLSVVGLSTAEGKRFEYRLPAEFARNASGSVKLTDDQSRQYTSWKGGTYTEAGEKRTVWLAAVEAAPTDFARVDAAKGTGTQPVKASKQA